jgi:predicted phage terminase large subunit-like protein
MQITISPQPGPQTQFLQSSSDITILGGGAGGGKSYGLLLAALRHVNNPEHKAVIFRKTSPMLRNSGSIYDEAKNLYLQLGAKCNDSSMTFRWKSGATISFSHLSDSSKRYGHQGAQYSMIGFDELTHFDIEDFVYLLSRLRNPSIKPQCYATCNPDSSSFVKDIINPFLDDNQQYADKEKCVKHIYISFSGDNNVPIFATDKQEKYLSLRFIPANLDDNKILQDKDPLYREKLESLSHVEREQLLRGDWNVSWTSGNIFRRNWFIPINPTTLPGQYALAFDLASTEVTIKNKNPDFSAATLLQRNGFNYYIVKNWKIQASAGQVYSWMKGVVTESQNITKGSMIRGYIEREPGSASKREEISIKQQLPQLNIEFIPSTKNKVVRARPLSAEVQKGNVYIFKGSWNEEFLRELEAFPSPNVHDDCVDSTTLAFNQLSQFRF